MAKLRVKLSPSSDPTSARHRSKPLSTIQIMKLLDEILMDLVPYMDKVFLCPLSEKEILQIEEIYAYNLPEYYKYFLERVGLRQDFVWGLNSKISQFNDISEFISSNEYFRFGHNGGEDYWLLNLTDENDRTVYEYDYYCNGEILSTEKTFNDILINAFDDIKKNYHDLRLNEDKVWTVEFGVNTNSAKFFSKELGNYVNVKLLKEPKVNLSTDEEDYESGLIEIEGNVVELKKWTSSRLSFNWEEPVLKMRNKSAIQRIETALKKCVFNHSLVQYGIMSKSDK